MEELQLRRLNGNPNRIQRGITLMAFVIFLRDDESVKEN
jgi:hypothetical protein